VAVDPAGQVYGTALYESAEANGHAKAIEPDLVAIRDAIAASPELTRLLWNPAFPARGKKQILLELATGSDPLVRNLLQVLVDNGRLSALSDVVDVFAARVRESEQQLEV
jgi:ATP synthase F1 delta subunit